MTEFNVIWLLEQLKQSCPEYELDFRDQQCVFYNNQSFHGETYSWESYVVGKYLCFILIFRPLFPIITGFKYRNKIRKIIMLLNLLNLYLDEAECELNCKPVGMNYFATLKDRVVDGTSCLFPVDFVRQNHSGRAMCVDGICKVRVCLSIVLFGTETVYFYLVFSY